MTDILTRQLLPSDQAVESRVGEETVILHLESGAYYGLDHMGTRVWELLKEGVAPIEIGRILVRDHDAPPEIVEADVRRLLSELHAHGIIVDG